MDAYAQQETVVTDSIRHAKIVSERIFPSSGSRIVSLPRITEMVSVTGEADIVKFIQTLPGVSTGAEGSSAIYVRGGNLGSNVTTLDGVPVYGGSHLLGMTSSYPMDIISAAEFRLGGFGTEDINMTSSHINLTSKDGSFSGRSVHLSVSNFILGGTYSAPIIKDRVSIISSLRISPAGPEFNLVRKTAGGALDSLDRVRIWAFDAFTKVVWRKNGQHTLSLSSFASSDAYRYIYGGDSDERIAWGNFILQARDEISLGREWLMTSIVSYNRFSSKQGVIRDMDGTINNIAIVNSLDEFKAESFLMKGQGQNELRMGALLRSAWFNPGTSSTFKGKGAWTSLSSPRSDNRACNLTHTIYFQKNWKKEGRYEFMTSAKGHLNVNNADPDGKWKFTLNVETGSLAIIHLTRWMAVEGTADWTVQQYHTLEGVPLGWSIDMIVPVDSKRPSENAFQTYGGLLMSAGRHKVTLGGYHKKMHNLVYFKDASKLFSPAVAGWKDNISVGTGTSQGLEFLYEKEGERLNYKFAYTWSKTNRLFPDINDGNPFPAKFDRRHIFNLTASYAFKKDSERETGLTGLFTYQSGHMETVPAGEYFSELHSGRLITVDYFTGVHNYQMPDYSRLDLGVYFRFNGNVSHYINIGVSNVFNKHNPFTITYDDRSGEWRQISLFPIMPSLHYSVEF